MVEFIRNLNRSTNYVRAMAFVSGERKKMYSRLFSLATHEREKAAEI